MPPKLGLARYTTLPTYNYSSHIAHTRQLHFAWTSYPAIHECCKKRHCVSFARVCASAQTQPARRFWRVESVDTVAGSPMAGNNTMAGRTASSMDQDALVRAALWMIGKSALGVWGSPASSPDRSLRSPHTEAAPLLPVRTVPSPFPFRCRNFNPSSQNLTPARSSRREEQRISTSAHLLRGLVPASGQNSWQSISCSR